MQFLTDELNNAYAKPSPERTRPAIEIEAALVAGTTSSRVGFLNVILVESSGRSSDRGRRRVAPTASPAGERAPGGTTIVAPWPDV